MRLAEPANQPRRPVDDPRPLARSVIGLHDDGHRIDCTLAALALVNLATTSPP